MAASVSNVDAHSLPPPSDYPSVAGGHQYHQVEGGAAPLTEHHRHHHHEYDANANNHYPQQHHHFDRVSAGAGGYPPQHQYPMDSGVAPSAPPPSSTGGYHHAATNHHSVDMGASASSNGHGYPNIPALSLPNHSSSSAAQGSPTFYPPIYTNANHAGMHEGYSGTKGSGGHNGGPFPAGRPPHMMDTGDSNNEGEDEPHYRPTVRGGRAVGARGRSAKSAVASAGASSNKNNKSYALVVAGGASARRRASTADSMALTTTTMRSARRPSYAAPAAPPIPPIPANARAPIMQGFIKGTLYNSKWFTLCCGSAKACALLIERERVEAQLKARGRALALASKRASIRNSDAAKTPFMATVRDRPLYYCVRVTNIAALVLGFLALVAMVLFVAVVYPAKVMLENAAGQCS